MKAKNRRKPYREFFTVKQRAELEAMRRRRESTRTLARNFTPPAEWLAMDQDNNNQRQEATT